MTREDDARGQQALGRWMIYAGWALVLALVMWWFRGIMDDRANPNRSVRTRTESGAREIVLERNRSGHFVASGSINGYPVTFLLDTGATDVSVPSVVADRIGLEPTAAVEYQTANGTATGYLTRLDRVSIGGIAVEDIRGSINPNAGFDEVLLGMSFLRRIEFTQRADEMILRQPL